MEKKKRVLHWVNVALAMSIGTMLVSLIANGDLTNANKSLAYSGVTLFGFALFFYIHLRKVGVR